VTVAGVVIAVFVWVYETTVAVEREWMRELLAPEVELGVVTSPELDALAGSRSTLRGYIRAQREPHTAARVLEAENELAHQIARDDGAETAAVRRARTAVSQARGTRRRGGEQPVRSSHSPVATFPAPRLAAAPGTWKSACRSRL